MLSPDTVLQNRYRIVRKLSAGGMGTVYDAVDLRFNSQVALKETHFTEEALRKQFEREAHLLYKMRHPAIARVIDHFTENEGQFLVMDYVEGEDLWEMLERQHGAFPVEAVLKWADQLLDALEYLHSQEPPIIHRDIKPQNLKLTARDQIILLDFGLAKGFAGQISRVTTSGSIFGFTPNYAPLEQIQGTGTDARSDLYSLAATLYNLLTGVMPPDVLTRLTATTDGQPDPLRSAHEVNNQVSRSTAGVLNKAMEIGRSQRFTNAAEMRQALHEELPAKDIGAAKTMVLPPPTIAAQPQAQIPNLPETIAASPKKAKPRLQTNIEAQLKEFKGNKDKKWLKEISASKQRAQERESREKQRAKRAPLIAVGFIALLIVLVLVLLAVIR
jgi:serine/threonine protein kinase